MNATRKAIVLKVFRSLDKDRSGTIDVDDLKDTYDASRHPDVISGKKTEDDILTEFLDTFELHYSLTVGYIIDIEFGFT